MYAYPPTQSDYVNFLYNVVGIPQTELPIAVANPTIAPVLSQSVGGALGAATYYVVYTYVSATGETLPSPEASLAVSANNLLTITSPASATNATGWNAYVSTATGTETLQVSNVAIGTNWTEPVTGLIAGNVVPTVNTTANATVIGTSLQLAEDSVNDSLSVASPDYYVLAVYNFAADRLVNYAPDQTGQTFFSTLRSNLKLSTFSGGVVSSTSDNGTSVSLLNPDQLKNLMLSDLQMIKTPWGRQYIEIAQKWGTTLWGLT